MAHKKSNSLPTILNYIGLVSAVLFIVSLSYNVRNRTDIISSLCGSSLGGVGIDAPVLAPLGVSVVAAALSWWLGKRKLSTVLIVTITILLVGITVWGFGLHLAVKNTYQQWVPTN